MPTRHPAGEDAVVAEVEQREHDLRRVGQQRVADDAEAGDRDERGGVHGAEAERPEVLEVRRLAGVVQAAFAVDLEDGADDDGDDAAGW